MALPINIHELLNGKTVEWDRIEFKAGWNPESIIRTICAFANDFNNWGGGYIVIGVEENEGVPILPPVGLQLSEIDRIQKRLTELCYRIHPHYFPIAEPVDFEGKKIIVLWCPGGSNRPYRAPSSLGDKAQQVYYIKKFSLTVQPSLEEEHELIALAQQIPFDDRVNNASSLADLDLSTIKAFLNKVQSDLENDVPHLSVGEVARKMNIAEGATEYLLPKNVGILFFGRDPQAFFSSAKIEFVIFQDEAGITFTEKIFTGPLHLQLMAALEYAKTSVIQELVQKSSSVAQASRVFNYPFAAFEEALCNAVYHRGYDSDATIEVRVFPSRLEIISYPGPLLPLNKEKLSNNQFEVRKYRNRRIGEFLKELHLTEGRATGIPTIIKALLANASPPPVFETDDERTYFKCSMKTHPAFFMKSVQVQVQVTEHANYFTINNLAEILQLVSLAGEQAREQVKEQVLAQVPQEKYKAIRQLLSLCKVPQKRESVLAVFGLSNVYKNYVSHILVLIENNLISRTIPDNPKDPRQRYYTTAMGIKLLEML